MRNFQFSLLVLISISAISTSYGQNTYIINAADSKVWVDGTSTLKNWSAQVATFDGKIDVDSSGEVVSVEINLDASTMDGGRGADMNNKIYKALKTTEHPTISFKGKMGSRDEGFDLASQGTLAIAGVSASVQIQGNGSLEERLTGTHTLKLSQFNIEPPTAMFGQIVCHDDITIGFDLSFTQ